MSEETKPETTKAKMLRQVDYKGAVLAGGATLDVEPHIAERLIAEGHAEAVADKKADKSEEKSSGKGK